MWIKIIQDCLTADYKYFFNWQKYRNLILTGNIKEFVLIKNESCLNNKKKKHFSKYTELFVPAVEGNPYLCAHFCPFLQSAGDKYDLHQTLILCFCLVKSPAAL